MKNNYLLLLTVLLLCLGVGNKAAAQCQVLDNFMNFASFDLTPTVQGPTGTQTSWSTWGGDYHKVDVVAGEQYEISTCNNTGPYSPGTSGWTGIWPVGTPHAGQAGYNVNWDPQMSLVQASTGLVVDFNDDFCGPYPAITYTATFTGELYIVLDSATVCDQFETDTIVVDVTWLVGCNDNTSSFSETACDSYTVPSGDETHTMSGVYMDTIPNVGGCDSVMTITVTINNSTSGSETVTACDSYTWPTNSTNYTMGGTYTHTLTNAMGCDSVVTLNLTINNSNTGSETVTACDSYTWAANSTTYTMGGTYMHTLTNAMGCDSVVTLNLTINNSNSGSETVTACDSYTWPTNSTTYTMGGTYTHTLTNAMGCDSVVTLNLTINNSNTGSETVTACDSYTWAANSTTYTMGGTYMHTLTNAMGCDSVVTLNLTINNSNSGSETVMACDSYTWAANSTTYTMGGTYTTTLTNAMGCDSVVTLNLTINNSTTGTESVTVCDSYTWPANSTTYTMSGTYTATLTNAMGCDSVVTLNLAIYNSTSGSQTVAACDSFTWAANATTYTMSGTYTATLTNAMGCDSVATLNLTINTLDLTTNTVGFTITANETGAAYQWLDCNNNYAIIAGATNQAYTATANGDYAVEITKNNCTDTSACANINGVGIVENGIGGNVRIYPNPSSGQFTMNFETVPQGLQIRIVSITGNEIMTMANVTNNTLNIDLSGYADGIYFVHLNDDTSQQVVKLLKQ